MLLLRSLLSISASAHVFKSSPSYLSKMSYSVVQRGALNKPSYRLFFKDEQGKYVSPFHDIPLR